MRADEAPARATCAVICLFICPVAGLHKEHCYESLHAETEFCHDTWSQVSQGVHIKSHLYVKSKSLKWAFTGVSMLASIVSSEISPKKPYSYFVVIREMFCLWDHCCW